MNTAKFNLLQLHKHGEAFGNFLALRKKHFVDDLHWDIPHDDVVEMDQYDNPTAWYSLVFQDEELIGGARVMPTTAIWGSHSYMLRDALHGKLGQIPKEIMHSDVSTDRVWEVTRLVMSDALETQVERSECLKKILNGVVDIASAQGAQELMSLSPVAMARALRQLGFNVRRDGEPYLNTQDGRRYAVLRMPMEQSEQENVIQMNTRQKTLAPKQQAAC